MPHNYVPSTFMTVNIVQLNGMQSCGHYIHTKIKKLNIGPAQKGNRQDQDGLYCNKIRTPQKKQQALY